MTLSASSLRALERHFIGMLGGPSPLWLDGRPESRVILYGGDALRRANEVCVIDFGTVESPGLERTIMEIAEVSAVDLEVITAGVPWLTARRLGGGALIELVAAHDVLRDTELTGRVRVRFRTASGEECREELRVRMKARRTHPLGSIDFHGAAEPRAFDFGVVGEPSAPYVVSFDSLTSVPLAVSFADLPAWLTLEVDGQSRQGPAEGCFFRRRAPFSAAIRPRRTSGFIGRHHGTLRVTTNDPRPHLRSIELRFSASFEPPTAFLRATPATTIQATGWISAALAALVALLAVTTFVVLYVRMVA